jgi:hypothetical protein
MGAFFFPNSLCINGSLRSLAQVNLRFNGSLPIALVNQVNLS